jgi:hypothetical protein
MRREPCETPGRSALLFLIFRGVKCHFIYIPGLWKKILRGLPHTVPINHPVLSPLYLRFIV